MEEESDVEAVSHSTISPWGSGRKSLASGQLTRFLQRHRESPAPLSSEDRLKRLGKVLAAGRSTNPSALLRFIGQSEIGLIAGGNEKEKNPANNDVVTDESLSKSIKTVISCVENEISAQWANSNATVNMKAEEVDLASIVDKQLADNSGTDNFFDQLMSDFARDSHVFQCKALEDFLTNDKFSQNSSSGAEQLEKKRKPVKTAFSEELKVGKPAVWPIPVEQKRQRKSLGAAGIKAKRSAADQVESSPPTHSASRSNRPIRPPKRFADYANFEDQLEPKRAKRVASATGEKKNKRHSAAGNMIPFAEIKKEFEAVMGRSLLGASVVSSPVALPVVTHSAPPKPIPEVEEMMVVKVEPMEDEIDNSLATASKAAQQQLPMIRHDHTYVVKGAYVKKSPINRVLRIFKEMVRSGHISQELAAHFYGAVRAQQQNSSVKRLAAVGWTEDDEMLDMLDGPFCTKQTALTYLLSVCPEMVLDVPTPLIIKQVLIVLCYLEVEGLGLAYKLQDEKTRQDQLLGKLVRLQHSAQLGQPATPVLEDKNQSMTDATEEVQKKTKAILDNFQRYASARSRWAALFGKGLISQSSSVNA